MSVNKYRPHVFVLPEDDANRQIAIGFSLDEGLDARSIQVLPSVGGWTRVRDEFVLHEECPVRPRAGREKPGARERFRVSERISCNDPSRRSVRRGTRASESRRLRDRIGCRCGEGVSGRAAGTYGRSSAVIVRRRPAGARSRTTNCPASYVTLLAPVNPAGVRSRKAAYERVTVSPASR